MDAEPTLLPAEDHASAALGGSWTLAFARGLAERIDRLQRPFERLDAEALAALDTAGALLILRLLGQAEAGERQLDAPALKERVVGLSPGQRELLVLVASKGEPAPPEPPQVPTLRRLLARVGAAVLRFRDQTLQLLGFIGLTLVTLLRTLTGRRRLRLTATVFHMEQTGLDAVPIVALLSFLVGAVVAFLGATVLADFGASIFTVELVAYAFLREFGVLLTAILLAGRSGSAFTAQIGSMKSREELDAIKAMGLDPIELLVLPRLIALWVMLPLLSFIGMMTGILGGGLVAALSLDISPAMFLTRIYEMTEVRHFWVGMVKAPVFAFIIAVVGCLEGLKVEGSAESVGRHTTASVVQSIFLVIVVDALFAIFFMELGI